MRVWEGLQAECTFFAVSVGLSAFAMSILEPVALSHTDRTAAMTKSTRVGEVLASSMVIDDNHMGDPSRLLDQLEARLGEMMRINESNKKCYTCRACVPVQIRI